MAKKAAKKKTAKKKLIRRPFTKEDVKALKAHSKAKNACREDCKRAKAHRRLTASEGNQAGHRPRTPTLIAYFTDRLADQP